MEVKSVRDYYKEICKNERQRQAVESCKNTVVIAGPGSGKTRIISMKAALLRSQDIGVACISFGNPTEMRIRDQLLEMGIREDDHLFVGTVHGFCLKYIVYPFINLIENDWPTNFSIASEFHVNDALNYTVSKLRTKQLRPSDISRIQKQLILGISVSTTERKIVSTYENYLLSQSLVDFEMIIQWAVNALNSSSDVAAYIAYHFGWILIDEYQDLGGGLHKLAVDIVEKTDIKMLAVGDPNQLIYEFTGADAYYMTELIDKFGFEKIETEICYRFGAKLIAASSGALGKYLPYRPALDVVSTHGEVRFWNYNTKKATDMTDQFVYEFLLQNELSKNKDTAILYVRNNNIADAMRMSLQRYDIDYVDEKNSLFPDGPIIVWLRKCAEWALTYISGNLNSTNLFSDLFSTYCSILRDAGLKFTEDEEERLEEYFLQTLLRNAETDFLALSWLDELCKELQIFAYLEQASNRKGEIRDLLELMNLLKHETLADIRISHSDKGIILTTIHSAKGREFDTVILLGVQNGELPWAGKADNISFRNQFYVACTRARKELHLVTSPNLEVIMPWGELKTLSASPYIQNIKNAIIAYNDEKYTHVR